MAEKRVGTVRALAAFAILIVAGCSSESSPSGSTGSTLPSDMPEAISTAGCTPGQHAFLSGRTLNIAASPLAPPYIFTDPKERERVVGFDADFVEAWTRCLGVKYRWDVYQEVPAMIAAVQSGRADIVHSELYVNPTRAEQVDFVVYMKSLTGSAVQKGNPKSIRSLDDLCGKTVAQAVGVLEVPLVEGQSAKCQREGKPAVDLVVHRDNNVAVQAVVTGRADAFLGDKVYVESIAKSFPDKADMSFVLDNNLNIGLGVNRQQPDLRQAILAAIKAIQSNGTEERLLTKWRLDVEQIVPAYEAK